MKEIYYDFGYDEQDRTYQVKLYAGYHGEGFSTTYFDTIKDALVMVKDLNTAGVTQRHKTDD